MVPASALQEAVPAFKLGMPFPAARSLKVGCRCYCFGMNTAAAVPHICVAGRHGILAPTHCHVRGCLLFPAT